MLLRKCTIVIFAIFFLASCKKDLLHFTGVQQLDSQTTSDRLCRILFVNDTLGFIVGGQRFYTCTILKTTDGGYTWTKNSFPDAGKCLYGITLAPWGTLYSVGFDGKILSSGNMGNNWKYYQSWYLPYSDIGFFDPQHGVIIGGVSFNAGYRLLIDSSGNSVKRDSLGYQFNRIKILDNHTAYICGYGIFQKTTDAGQSWTFLTIGGNDNFQGMDVHNENDIWLCGYSGSVVHTTDGGNSFQWLRNGNKLGIPKYRLLDIVFDKNDINGWAVGENGVCIHSDDGGQHWMEYDHFTDNALRSIVICSNGDLLVAGDNGALYRLKP